MVSNHQQQRLRSFWMVARGPTKVDYQQLLKLYKQVEINPIEIVKITSKPEVVCDILKLAANEQTKEILIDLLDNIFPHPAKVIEKQCEGHNSSLSFLAERKVTGDNNSELKEMLSALVKKSDEETIAKALDKPEKLTKVLGIVKEQALGKLKGVIGEIPPAVKPNLDAWVEKNPSPEVYEAIADKMSVQDVVDAAADAVTKAQAAAEAPPADLTTANETANKAVEKLSGLYKAKYIDRTGDVEKLVTEAPSTGGADRFLHFLARLEPNKTNEIWKDVLTKLGDETKVTAQLSLKGDGDKQPFEIVIDKLATVERDDILSLMVEKGKEGTVALVGTQNRMDNLLGAVLNVKPALLSNTMKHIKPILKRDLRLWALMPRSEKNTVTEALKTSGAFTDEDIISKVAIGPGQDTEELLFLYNIVIDGDTTKALALSNKISGTEKFSHLLAKLRADQATEALWNKYLSAIGEKTTVAKVLGEKIGTDSPFSLMLDDTKRPPWPNDDYEFNRKNIIMLMIEKGGAGLALLADDQPKMDTLLNTVFAKNKELKAIFDQIKPTDPQNDLLIAWAKEHPSWAEEVLKATGREDVLTGMAQEVFDEAAKGPGSTDTTLLEKLYSKINNTKSIITKLADLVTGDKDKFVHLLAKLPADKNTKKVWDSYLNRHNELLDNTKISKRIAEELTATGKDNKTPFDLMFNDTNRPNGDDNDERNKIIALMVGKGGQTIVRLADDKDKMEKMLNAILNSKLDAADNILWNVLNNIDTSDAAGLRVNLLAWIKDKAGEFVKYSEVFRSFGNSEVKNITKDEVIDEIKATIGTTANLGYLFALYNRYVKGSADRKQAVKELVETPITGQDHFIHYLVKLPANEFTYNILNDLLTKADALGIKDQIIKSVDNQGKSVKELLNRSEIKTQGDQLGDERLGDMQGLVK